jgi:hypothetical protein
VIATSFYGLTHPEKPLKHRWRVPDEHLHALPDAAPRTLLHPAAFLLMVDWLRHKTGNEEVQTLGVELLKEWLSGLYDRGHITAEAHQFRQIIQPVAAQVAKRIWTGSCLEAMAQQIVGHAPVPPVEARPVEGLSKASDANLYQQLLVVVNDVTNAARQQREMTHEVLVLLHDFLQRHPLRWHNRFSDN